MLIAARFLAMPLGGVALLEAGTRLDLIPRDPLLRFLLLMEACMPSAQNSVNTCLCLSCDCSMLLHL